jgi:hypothetical protein
MTAPRRIALICFAVVILVALIAALLTLVLPDPEKIYRDDGTLAWLGWLVALPILGAVSARHGNPRELLAGCLGAAVGAVAVIEVPHLVEWVLEGLPDRGFVLEVVTIATVVSVPFLVVGGITLTLAQARGGRVGPTAPTR